MTSYFKEDRKSYEWARQKYLKKLYEKIGDISCGICGKTAKIKLWNKNYSIDGDVEIHHEASRKAHPELAGEEKNFRPRCSKHHYQIHFEGKAKLGK